MILQKNLKCYLWLQKEVTEVSSSAKHIYLSEMVILEL